VNHLVPITFLDTLSLTSNLRLRHWKAFEGGRIDLRTEEGDQPIVDEWASAKSILARLRNESAPFFGGAPADIGEVWIERLDARAWTAWETTESDWLRLHCTLAPSPLAAIHSGPEAANPGVGMLTFVDTRQPWCMINLDQKAALIFLVAHVKKPS
jgi:hypothetical protein